MFVVTFRSALIVALGALLGAPTLAYARGPSGPDTLREALIGSVSKDGRTHQHAPVVARYVSSSGSGFVLDRSGGDQALLRFDRDSEIWALRAVPGPGGDVIYKNDLGQPVVRASRLGGVTLFTRDRPSGVPVSLQGESSPFRSPSLTPAALLQVLRQASLKSTRALGRLIDFDAGHGGGQPVDQDSAYVVADAASVAADALARMAALREGRPYLSRLRSVRIVVGRKADAMLDGSILTIVVAPSKGVAGRPSSGRIAQAVVDGD
jgi:hypothetical protein